MAAQIEIEFARELKGLQIFIEQTRAGVLAFSLYSDVGTRDDAAVWLANNGTATLQIVRLAPGFIDLGGIIESVPPMPRRGFFFFDIEAAFPKILGYVNLNRERLLQYGHALVFWIREEGLRRIAESAPDFWAWRSHVFDFRTAQNIELGPTGPHDPVIGHYAPAQLKEQVEALEESGGSDFVSQLALGRRLVALGRFQESSTALQQAIVEAERQGDERGLAEALLLLGNSKLEEGLLDEARPLYERSLEIANHIGSKQQIMAAIRQLSLLAQRIGDQDTAYRFALMVMDIAQSLENPSTLASAYDQLGNVLFSRKDLRGAEQAYLAAVKYEEQLGHRADLAFTLARLGRVYEEMGASSQAETILRRAGLLWKEFATAPNPLPSPAE